MAEAEAELGVVFPAEYRAHLLDVSAGGAVALLRRTERGWWWDANDGTRRDLLPVPFPHPDAYWDGGPEDCEECASCTSCASCEEFEAFEDGKTAGAVVAQEHGCGFSTLLVVTGPLAGTMWWDGRATCDLIVPLSLDHGRGARPVTFGEWLASTGSWDLLPPGWG